MQQIVGSTAEEVCHHYDVGNGFFGLWLDPGMSYSCALFENAETLDEAQTRKLDHHLTAIGAGPGREILDIGCGWGAALRRAVDRFHVSRAVGITVSMNQIDYIRQHPRPGIEVSCENWLDYRPGVRFDGVLSVGAFEHFARRNATEREKIEGYRQFFRKCWEWLKPGAMLSLQTIAYGNMLPADQSRFLFTEIYPESELPALSEIASASRGLFEIRTLRNDREHYERTLRYWLRTLAQNESRAVEQYGPHIVDRYKKYLRLSILGFHLGNTDLLRIAFRRNDRPCLSADAGERDAPATREDVEESRHDRAASLAVAK